MLKLQDRIKSKRKHDERQAFITLIEFTVSMLVIIVLCSINDQTLDNLFR